MVAVVLSVERESAWFDHLKPGTEINVIRMAPNFRKWMSVEWSFVGEDSIKNELPGKLHFTSKMQIL